MARVRHAIAFLLVTFIAMVYILKFSTQSYKTIYTKEEWLPSVVERSNRRAIQVDVNASSAFGRDNYLTPMTANTQVRSKLAGTVTTRNEYKTHPRVVFSNRNHFNAVRGRRIQSKYDLGSLYKLMTRGRPSWSLPTNTTFCVPMESWQTTSFPTCNNIHEISLENDTEEQARLLGTGGWRGTWKVDNTRGETVAFKTLK